MELLNYKILAHIFSVSFRFEHLAVTWLGSSFDQNIPISETS